jgi:hypothetical protein
MKRIPDEIDAASMFDLLDETDKEALRRVADIGGRVVQRLHARARPAASPPGAYPLTQPRQRRGAHRGVGADVAASRRRETGYRVARCRDERNFL